MRRDPHKEAARWWVRMGGAPLADAEAHAFQRWMGERPENAAAWADVELAWSFAGPAAAREPARSRRPAAPRFAWAIAACLAVAVLGAASFEFLSLRPAPRQEVAVQALRTGVGEIRRARLSDGSLLTLDADSALTVRMSGAARRIELTTGRAHFEVAHNARRPFSVTAGETTVVATGTSFDVNRLPGAVDVVLLQGGVDVRTPDQVVRLRPGQHVRSGAPGGLQPTAIDAAAAAGWLQGRLSFHDEPLADIAAQMNRYGGPRLVISDSRLAHARFSGVFMAGDGAALAEALRVARIGAPATERDGTIVVSGSASR